MRRRAVLGVATSALAGLAGCGEVFQRTRGGGPEETTTSRWADQSSVSLPYTGGGTALDVARGIRVTNLGDRNRYVTVSVYHGGTHLFIATRTIPTGRDGRQRYGGLVATQGSYRVVVETRDGRRAVHNWRIVGDLGDLEVLVGEGIRFRQHAWCDPDCPPASEGGTAADLPYYGDGSARQLYYGASLTVENRSSEIRRVGLDIRHEGWSILAYEYAIPPTVRLSLPGVHVPGEYTVAVTTEDGVHSHDWHIGKERWLAVTLRDEGVDIGCGRTTGEFRLENRTAEPQELTVTVLDAGEPLVEREYALVPGESLTDTDVLTGSGQFDLVVETADGRHVDYDWWLCPPRGPTFVTVEANGRLHVMQYVPSG